MTTPDIEALAARLSQFDLRIRMQRCSVDVGEAIRRHIDPLGHPLDKGVIATGGAAVALGVAAGIFARTTSNTTPQEAVDALWEKLRPMAIRALNDLQKRGEGRMSSAHFQSQPPAPPKGGRGRTRDQVRAAARAERDIEVADFLDGYAKLVRAKRDDPCASMTATAIEGLASSLRAGLVDEGVPVITVTAS